MDDERNPPNPLTLATVDGHSTAPDEPPVKVKPKPKHDKNGRFKAWRPTSRQRRMVETCKAAGLRHDQIAIILGKSRDALERNCRDELDSGAAKCNSRVVGKLFEKCMKGDTVALLFWCKTRLGWQEKQRVEHTGADGGPIQHETVEAEANAFTAKILNMAQRFEAAPAVNDAEAAPAAKEEAAK